MMKLVGASVLVCHLHAGVVNTLFISKFPKIAMSVSHHPILRLPHFGLQHIFMSNFMYNRNYEAPICTLLFSTLLSLFPP